MLTCSEALDSYYKEHIAVKRVARVRVEYAIAALLPFFKDVAAHAIDIPMCRAYRDTRRVSDSTVRRELGVLRAAVHHAIRWRRMEVAQLPSIELPPAAPPKTLWLFHEELEVLLKTASTQDRRVFRFVQLAYHTASRKRAIEELRWSQIDLRMRRINLQQPGAPLTNKNRPTVPLSVAMAEELASMKTRATTDFVLVTNDNIRPAFDRVATAAGLAILQQTGLRPQGRLTPHALRHSRATHLLEAGKDPWGVAKLLGDTLPTVLKVYGHVSSAYMDSLVS